MKPLSFTCFEEYLFHDDSPATPMVVTVRLRFVGFLEPKAFQDALSTVMTRHPLLRATACRTRFGGMAWTEHPEWLPAIHWHVNDDGENTFPKNLPLDLTREPGIQLWVQNRHDGHDAVMRIHHCCTDGKGFMGFIEDLLIAYTMRQDTSASGLALRNLDPRRLRRRGMPGLRGWKYLKAVLLPFSVVNSARKFFLRSPARITGGKKGTPEKALAVTQITPLFFVFSREESQQLISSARALRASINDLLVRDLFLAVGVWRENMGLGHTGDWLRFSIPMDLREAEDVTMPMANSISLVFLDRRRRDFKSRDYLLQSIQRDMVSFKGFLRKHSYIFSVGIARFLPGGLARLTRKNKCFATTCFSNVGRVLDRIPLPLSDGRVVAGNVLLESLDVVAPPLRRHMDVTFSAHTYGGRLQLVLNYNSLVIQEHDARELLEMYVQEIRQTLQEGRAG